MNYLISKTSFFYKSLHFFELIIIKFIMNEEEFSLVIVNNLIKFKKSYLQIINLYFIIKYLKFLVIIF